MIKACIFDMDGTVLDTIGTITYYVNITLRKFGIREISEDECKKFVGNGAKILIERTLKSRGILDAELLSSVLESYNSAYDENPTYLTAPYEEILDLLSALKSRGIKIGIVSNKPDFLTRPLSERFFGTLIDLAVGGKEGVPLKPAPDSVLGMLKDFGVSPTECAYIGDTGVDMKTGKNAGAVLTVGVLWGFRTTLELLESGADVLVDRPLKILDEVLNID
ncbi:MAG: HAD family hydrolase [Clostridia bacterium]|nr:HAD family hydrolase [Clostridia bacterium]